MTMDGTRHAIDHWDMLIAHPPCTYLTAAGSMRLFNADHTIRDWRREAKLQEAREFFMQLWMADVERIAVENPAPMHYAKLPPYTQIVEPYQFGHPWKKRTCLWLKNLPPLQATEIVTPRGCWVSSGSSRRTKLRELKGVKSAKERSKTFPGIAAAMAEQWGGAGDYRTPHQITMDELLEEARP